MGASASPGGLLKGQTGELRSLLKLGGPLALGEVGWMSTYIVDAIMVGHLPHSALAIAASSLGNSIFYAAAFAIVFMLNGLETMVAQAYGRKDLTECTALLVQSFWIVIVGTPLVMVSTWGVFLALPHLGTPPELIAQTRLYLLPLLPSAFPLLAYMSLRRYLQSCDHVFWVTVSLLLASGVNGLFDWIFLFGHLGAHPMGIAGSAWSTEVVRIFMLVLLVIGCVGTLRKQGQWPDLGMVKPTRARLGALLHLGWPSGLESLTEFGTTTYLSILCSRLGPVLLAGNQVLLDLTALVYQLSIGLGYATVVRVGQNAGRKDNAGVRRAARVSAVFGTGLMVTAGVVFAAFPHEWASLYTNSAAVVGAAVPFFGLCSLTLVTDTLFVLLASALTGVGDTRTPMIVSVTCNWGIGMVVAYLLTGRGHHGLMGLWAGRLSGSVAMAGLLLLLWWRRGRAVGSGERKGEDPERRVPAALSERATA